jgi:GNAT superfamily N-acetyltransferase
MTPTPAFRLRLFTAADVPAGLRLTQAQNWSHRLEDWQFHQSLGQGFCLVDDGDNVVGTTLWWPYGHSFGSVGLVVVDAAHQGRGLGRRLMDAVFEAAGPRTLQLCATPAGLKLYQQCGFVETGRIWQRQGVPRPRSPPSLPARLQIIAGGPQHLDALCRCDAAAFGAERTEVLQCIVEPQNVQVALQGGSLLGFALARPSGRGTVIGPIVAPSTPVAIALVAAHLSQLDGIVRLDVPADCGELNAWLDSAGIPRVDEVVRMIRGTPIAPAQPGRIFSLVSQAMG